MKYFYGAAVELSSGKAISKSRKIQDCIYVSEKAWGKRKSERLDIEFRKHGEMQGL